MQIYVQIMENWEVKRFDMAVGEVKDYKELREITTDREARTALAEPRRQGIRDFLREVYTMSVKF